MLSPRGLGRKALCWRSKWRTIRTVTELPLRARAQGRYEVGNRRYPTANNKDRLSLFETQVFRSSYGVHVTKHPKNKRAQKEQSITQVAGEIPKRTDAGRLLAIDG